MAKQPMGSSFHSKRWYRKFFSTYKKQTIKRPCDTNSHHSMAPIIYTPEGEEIREQLWKEMLEELSFANVETVLNDIRGTSI